MNTEQREYPFDTDDLHKGSVIPGALIAKAYGVRQDSPKFGLTMMQAADFVERRLGERGLQVMARQRKGDLVILTDEQAVYESEREHRSGLSRAVRAHADSMRSVDRASLAEKTRADHDRMSEVRGRTIAAFRKERRVLPPTAAKRSTPLLPSKDEP